MTYVFDIECYKNYFSSTFKDVKSDSVIRYEIYHDVKNISKNINQINELYSFIKLNNWLIGYNSHFYDNQLINYIYKNYNLFKHYNESNLTYELKILSDKIIDDNILDYKYNLPFKELDLMKIGGLNKSLKSVAANLKWHKIQDLPISEKSFIKTDELELIREYNLNDVLITEKLYNNLVSDIKVRFDLSKDFELDLTNDSVSGITNKILKKYYSEITGLKFDFYKNINTKRSSVLFSDIIFNDVKFETKEFNNILSNFKTLSWSENSTKEEIINIGNLKLISGYGGIHSVDNPGIFESNNNSKIIDLDIRSGYASLIINKNICPEHIDARLINKYSIIKALRDNAESIKYKEKADCLKRILTMLYGKTYSKTHWLYDVEAALKVVVNTQLYILMLIEKFIVNNIKILSVNTDGILCVVDNEKNDIYNNIYKSWCNHCNLDVSIDTFKKYIRKDINNYIAIKEDDSVKLKGFFSINKDYNNNSNNNIIPISINEYFINNKNVLDTVLNHVDIYDFCSCVRSDENSYNESYSIEDGVLKTNILQKNIRYYVSNRGCSLFKCNKNNSGKLNYCEGKNLTIFNNFVYNKTMSEYDINYKYYISEANKIINLIKNTNEQRMLFE